MADLSKLQEAVVNGDSKAAVTITRPSPAKTADSAVTLARKMLAARVPA